ncbi:MAG: hypothetical protein M1825_002704 [Sarcosagium campestre]|nr:MAG: hypothetical protein M1825_002704 [Sarcosagium campestre]
MDEATACLVLSLQLEDVETLIDRRKGKSKEGVLSDFEVALDLHREELRRNDNICADRRMCRSIGLAVEDDGLLLVQERAAETRAFNDRQIACRLGGIRPQSLSVASEAGVEPVDEDLVAKLRSLNFSNESLGHESGDKSDLGESSSAAVECFVRAPNDNPPRRCVACTEVRGQADMMLAPCEHEYCRDCISDLFSAATTDESLFPPRCCNRHISLATVQSFLSPDLVRRFEERSVEFRTPNKTYCVSPTCSAFIPVTTTENDAATCPECGQLTCTVCKGPGHEGDCPENEPLQQVLQAASENGWQRCHSCKRLIELEIGCNHIVYVDETLIFYRLHVLIRLVDVCAAQNFATCAVSGGKLAHVLSGTKVVFTREQTKSSPATTVPMPSRWCNRFKRRSETCVNAIIAATTYGVMSEALISAKNAVTIFHSTSLSVVGVGSKHAIAADGIDSSPVPTRT